MKMKMESLSILPAEWLLSAVISHLQLTKGTVLYWLKVLFPLSHLFYLKERMKIESFLHYRGFFQSKNSQFLLPLISILFYLINSIIFKCNPLPSLECSEFKCPLPSLKIKRTLHSRLITYCIEKNSMLPIDLI